MATSQSSRPADSGELGQNDTSATAEGQNQAEVQALAQAQANDGKQVSEDSLAPKRRDQTARPSIGVSDDIANRSSTRVTSGAANMMQMAASVSRSNEGGKTPAKGSVNEPLPSRQSVKDNAAEVQWDSVTGAPRTMRVPKYYHIPSDPAPSSTTSRQHQDPSSSGPDA